MARPASWPSACGSLPERQPSANQVGKGIVGDVQEKVRATPGAAMRRRSRMSDMMYRSAPEPSCRGGGLRCLAELGSPEGSVEMELGGSPSSGDEDEQVCDPFVSGRALAEDLWCVGRHPTALAWGRFPIV